MKNYIVKPEYLTMYDATPMSVLTDADIEQFAADWGKDPAELTDQLIELPDSCWTPIHRFTGKPSWQELNDLIREDSGVQEDYCPTEADYANAVREGWIKFDGYYTTIYAD